MDIRETNSDYEMEKRKFANIHFKKKKLYLVKNIRGIVNLFHNT